MKQILDEMAAGFSALRTPQQPRPIIASIDIFDQFEKPLTPGRWYALASELHCLLPPLRRRGKSAWSLPKRCGTLTELAAIVAKQHPDWVPPDRVDVPDWQSAQVFVGVREVLVEALNIEPDEVVRSATLQGDLGAA